MNEFGLTELNILNIFDSQNMEYLRLVLVVLSDWFYWMLEGITEGFVFWYLADVLQKTSRGKG